jgi:gamma-glutamylputrescine oxidase
MATEPRDDVPSLIPGNEAVADQNFVLNYFRRSADNRLLFGGRVSYSTLPPPSLGASMLRRAVEVFPQLKDARVEYVWGGNVDITVNRAPHFGRLADNILFAHGFSGHGVALTGLAGKLAAEAVAGQAGRFDTFSRIPHARFPGGPALRTPALLLATSWFRLRDML